MSDYAPKKSDTPLMRQYKAKKAEHPDSILLFRMGDFYETFGEDAVKTSAILGITLTKRGNGSASEVALAGFPHHALDTYLPKLVRAGERVAVCDQLEDPKTAKGLVERGVIEILTPGVAPTDTVENSFLASVYFGKESTGVAFLDLSTGEFYVAEGTDGYVDKLLSNFRPKEVLYPRGMEDRFADAFGAAGHYVYRLDEWVFSERINREKLCKQFGTPSLKGFGVEEFTVGISAAGTILYYLDFTHHKDLDHIRSLSRVDQSEYVWLDRFTVRNLELFGSSSGREGSSLAEVLDQTSTPMGSRLLRRWIAFPIRNKEQLEERLDVVESFVGDEMLSDEVAARLSQICDMERCASRLAAQRISPREIVALGRSLEELSGLKSVLAASDCEPLCDMAEQIEVLRKVRERIEHDLWPDPESNQIQKGGGIAANVDAELDDLRDTAKRGKEVLEDIRARETDRTGIPLKISFNNVFGYYIEVRNTHKDKVPAEWVRKQTLTGAERYITPELKEYEEKILTAEERIIEIEVRVWTELLEFLSESLAALQRNAALVGRVDCLLSFATQARKWNYCRPELVDPLGKDEAAQPGDDGGCSVAIIQGRHPVIETLLGVGEHYIPNDVTLDAMQQILMITGPNMSGKSALLRQTALIVLMAQMGSFVPAKAARVGLVDKIFTRVGASDNLSQGESTFMVEMLETATILHNATPRSLVLLDEIGRGTSTYDGMSIAWAIVEYLHDMPASRARTLFATHYHELNEMELHYEHVKNFHVTVQEVDGTVVFMRRLEPGGTEHSFGIHVANMAGLPTSVIRRAEKILEGLEASSADVLPTHSGGGTQMQLFELADPVLAGIRDQLKGLNLNELTPIEALNKLNEIKRLADS